MASGTDLAIAIGTIATAVVAAAGLAVSLWISTGDRDRANEQATADRQAATNLAAADRAAAREDAARRHIIDLLLELGRQVAAQAAYQNMPQGAEVVQQITLLLHALPAECAYVTRQRFNITRRARVPGAVGAKLQHLDLGSVAGDADAGQMTKEIAYDIDRYLTSGQPPARVWDDLDDLQIWQREHWPRS